MTVDPGAFSLKAYYDRAWEERRPALTCRATTVDEWRHWRAALRARLADLLGPFPNEPGSPRPTGLDRVETDRYVRQKITFDSEPGMTIPAYLFTPRDAAPGERLPALLCLHGHGRGKDDVAGIASSPKERQQRIRALNYDYGHRLAEQGYVVLAPDARGFGELAADGMTCAWAMTAGLLLGKVLVGLRAWDAMRAIDYLQTLPHVDPARIGCIGFSWGGTHTMYTAALDDRVRVAVISGAFGSFKDALIDAPECPCQYVPNLLQWADLADIVALIAPRPLLIEQGADDPHYTREVAHAEYERVRRLYALLGHAERVAFDPLPGNHRFGGDTAGAWLARWL
ncbi:MAG: dienelactone hydrolase family protein [Chloroflexota bacterium]|nr:dienelactone hydrolase family protein [Chloroflexota bacterium]